MDNLKKLGIIAGNGKLPLVIVEECERNNVEPVCVLIKDFANPEDYKNVNTVLLSVGLIGKAIEFFKKNQVTQIVFAGGVKKPSLSSVRTDFKGLILLKELIKNKLFGDNKTLQTIVKFFEKEEFTILKVDDVLLNNKIEKGSGGLLKFQHKKYANDIQIGIEALKQMSDLDMGQAIVVQQGVILAVECIEGTAELIKRCGELKYKEGKQPVLVKMKKKNQIKEADIPVIGEDTIEQLKNAGFAGVAIDADNCLVLNKKTTLNKAEEEGIFVVGI
jgi:UDP-2,3-diacylglucosamine hydrolase